MAVTFVGKTYNLFNAFQENYRLNVVVTKSDASRKFFGMVSFNKKNEGAFDQRSKELFVEK